VVKDNFSDSRSKSENELLESKYGCKLSKFEKRVEAPKEENFEE